MATSELEQYKLPEVTNELITRDDILGLIQGQLNQVTRPINYGSGSQVFRVSSDGLQLGSGTFASAPFRVTMAGAVTATSITITGGTLNYGKTSFADTTNAGYWLGTEGIYVGATSDTSKLKYTIADGSFEFIGTVSGRSTVTLAASINSSGNLVTDIINARLDSSTKKILSDFNFGSTDYAGAVNAGNVTWNTTTGAITGGSGVIVYRKGIVGVNAGVSTFSIDATTGAATFAGTLSAPSGTIGGFTIASTTLTATNLLLDSGNQRILLGTSNNIVILDAADGTYRLWAGNATAASAPFSVSKTGALIASNATITGAITATSGAIGGWTISTASITAGSGSSTVGLDSTVTGGDDVRIYAGSATPGSAPFRVTEAGALVATNATITGAITATTGAIGGFSIGTDYVRDAANSFGLASTVSGSDDVRFWAGDTFANRATAPFFVTEAGNLTANTATIVGTISGRSTSTIAGAINSSGNLITDLINARLDSATATILSDFDFGTTNYAGAVNAGGVTWNTTTGAITGGSGVILYRKGILGVNAGVTTFSIDATTGAATFAGALSAPTGNIGGFTIASTTLSATNLTLTSGAANTANIAVGTGSNLAGLNSANASSDIAMWAGDTFANRATAPFRVTAGGAVAGTNIDIINDFGDGSDGALSITSGTTQLNTAGKYIYQHTSVSITSTGILQCGSNLYNHPIYIFVQGDLTITSSATPAVDWDYAGGTAGTGGTAPGAAGTGGYWDGAIEWNNGASQRGVGGTQDTGAIGGSTQIGGAGGGGAGWSTAGTAGSGAGANTGGPAGATYYWSTSTQPFRHILAPYTGGGGGGGGATSTNYPTLKITGSVGGKGGGTIIFIVHGNINVTSTFRARGEAGTVAGDDVPTTTSGAAGGGGGGGFIGIYYKGSVTANSATFTVTGGAGGGTGTYGGRAGGTGGDGRSEVRLIKSVNFVIST